ncbi:MAG: NAD-dependent DNA ligase LigA [Phycisphaerales bacterium]|jgi:DNA ligase (NAD+)|nr:NAD-dependent DNA ligase LigA [Phycisphaerales bacterium]MBT7171280.1 NAD-dependent DNA ligase LigA [Phycisphaerales bacterium]
MSTEPIQQEMAALAEQIEYHEYLYRVKDAPEISDAEYDRLFNRLCELEAAHPTLADPNSPTQRVGDDLTEGFAKVEHTEPMLSVDNTYSQEELLEFDAQVRRGLGCGEFAYWIEPKIDGIAAAVRYIDGVLDRVITRGDGSKGDDITNNARTIRSLPLKLRGDDVPATLEVRGEIFWTRSNFAAWNAGCDEDKRFANPRNGAAGTMKSKNPQVAAERKLSFFAHGFTSASAGGVAETAEEMMDKLQRWGIVINPCSRRCKTMDEVWTAITEWLETRNEVDYETDGMVVKVDELTLRGELGATSRFPKWCIAYKYDPEQAETVLRSVDFQVGRSGVITPVAHFDPVQLAGTTVSNASLHNFDQIERLDARVGDTVVVEKAGEIIPQVVSVLFDKRPGDAKVIETPKTCPACDGAVESESDQVALRCGNENCPEKRKQKLIYFAGRDQMDIEGLGPAVVEQLVDAGLVNVFADLYALSYDTLVQRGGFNEKVYKTKANEPSIAAQKLIAAIDASRSRGLARVLAALGIPKVGTRLGDKLAEAFTTIDALESASADEIQMALEDRRRDATNWAIAEAALHAANHGTQEQSDSALRYPSIDALLSAMTYTTASGKRRQLTDRMLPARLEALESRFATPAKLAAASVEVVYHAMMPEGIIAETIWRYFHRDGGAQTVAALAEAGVSMSALQAANVAQTLAGKTIVLTGTLTTFGKSARKAATDAAKAAGAKVTSSVSKNTDFVVVGDNAGSKADKAASLGVEQIDEAEFRRRLGTGETPSAVEPSEVPAPDPDSAPAPEDTAGPLFG